MNPLVSVRWMAVAVAERLRKLTFRGRLLIGVWGLFAILVLGRVHGSSIALSAQVWAPAEAGNHFVATPLLDAMGPAGEKYRSALMAVPRDLRSDEWASNTMWALAQSSHEPRFPVRNLNFASGMNMLLVPTVPVAHLSTIARPQTWGYFLFGRYGGLSWSWWFPPFFCFTTLFLVFEIVLRRHPGLAAFGAFWFCGSAYVILWSNWPAYDVGFAALLALAAYHLFCAPAPWQRALWAGAAAIAIAATVMRLYPPWTIPVAYAFAAILGGLFVRDRVWLRASLQRLAVPLSITAVVTAVIVGSFYLSTVDDLRTLANTVYPGRRRMSGGDFPLTQLFGGFFNYKTSWYAPAALINGSEASGFFLFFPTVLLGVFASPRVRRTMDAVGWALLGMITFLTFFVSVGLPQFVADVTLLSRVTGTRCQLGIGLLSIALCLYLLKSSIPVAELKVQRHALLRAAIVVLGSGAFFLWQGHLLQEHAKLFDSPRAIPAGVARVAALVTAGAALLYLGRARLFALGVGLELVVTAGTYNPLAQGFPSIERSEMRRTIRTLVAADRQEGRNSLWLGTGGPKGTLIGNVLAVMGARTISGTFLHPPLPLWRALDPTGAQGAIYNRYAEVHFQLAGAKAPLRFTLPSFANYNLRASAFDPLLRVVGGRYIVTWGRDFGMRAPPARLVFQGTTSPFTIWELVDPVGPPVLAPPSSPPK